MKASTSASAVGLEIPNGYYRSVKFPGMVFCRRQFDVGVPAEPVACPRCRPGWRPVVARRNQAWRCGLHGSHERDGALAANWSEALTPAPGGKSLEASSAGPVG